MKINWENDLIFDDSDLSYLPDDIYGVYVMVKNGEVIYVGQNKDQSVRERMKQHFSSKEENELLKKELSKFDRLNIFYASIDRGSIDGIESFLCRYYNMPKCNKNMPSAKPIECNPPFENRS